MIPIGLLKTVFMRRGGVGIAHLSAYNYYGDVAPESKNYSRFIPVPIRLGLSFSYIFK